MACWQTPFLRACQLYYFLQNILTLLGAVYSKYLHVGSLLHLLLQSDTFFTFSFTFSFWYHIIVQLLAVVVGVVGRGVIVVASIQVTVHPVAPVPRFLSPLLVNFTTKSSSDHQYQRFFKFPQILKWRNCFE